MFDFGVNLSDIYIKRNGVFFDHAVWRLRDNVIVLRNIILFGFSGNVIIMISS